MIAGSLLLNREPEPLEDLWRNRVLHIAGLLLIWSFFYCMVGVWKNGAPFDLSHFFSRLYDTNWNYSYWYLYAYLAFLISLPFLQRLAQSLSNREYSYLFYAYMIFAMVIPSVEFLLFQGGHKINDYLTPEWLTSNIVIFPLAGYFLSFRVKDFWDKKKVAILWAIDIATILLASYMTWYQTQLTGTPGQAFHMTFVLVNSATIFVTCQYLKEHTQVLDRLAKPILSVGGCTFGIYLLHVYIKDSSGLNELLWHLFEETLHVPVVVYGFILCIAVFACGYVATLILKRIPGLQRLVS